MAEMGAGGLFASIRNNALPETGVRYFNTSVDGGVTWGTPYFRTTNQPPLPDPKCQGSLLRLMAVETKGPALVMLNAAHPTARSNAVLRVSYDQGRTWPESKVVYGGSSAYSALTEGPSREIGILLEIDNYKRIVFTRRVIGELSNDGAR